MHKEGQIEKTIEILEIVKKSLNARTLAWGGSYDYREIKALKDYLQYLKLKNNHEANKAVATLTLHKKKIEYIVE
jgi:hypothetical protein